MEDLEGKPADKVLLDGALKVDKKYKLAKTIIKGDEKIPIISLASIVAKTHRDKIMQKISVKFPQYGFHKNVGYGTAEHIKAIRKFGPTKIHRKTFIHIK